MQVTTTGDISPLRKVYEDRLQRYQPSRDVLFDHIFKETIRNLDKLMDLDPGNTQLKFTRSALLQVRLNAPRPQGGATLQAPAMPPAAILDEPAILEGDPGDEQPDTLAEKIEKAEATQEPKWYSLQQLFPATTTMLANPVADLSSDKPTQTSDTAAPNVPPDVGTSAGTSAAPSLDFTGQWKTRDGHLMQVTDRTDFHWEGYMISPEERKLATSYRWDFGGYNVSDPRWDLMTRVREGAKYH